jgi:hypothetical protein
MGAFGAIDNIAGAGSDILSSAVKNMDTGALSTAFRNIDVSDISTILKKIDTTALTKAIKNIPDDALSSVMKTLDDANLSRVTKNMDPSQLDNLRRLDDFGTVANKLDNIFDASKNVGKRFTSGTTKFCKKNPIMCASPLVYGGLKFLDKRAQDKLDEDRENDVRECISLCLPGGWDEYELGEYEQDDLEYKTKEDFEYLLGDGEDSGINWDEQPLCKQTDGNCGDFCTKKCEEVYPPRKAPCSITNPGGCLPDNPLDPSQWIEKLKEALNKMFGGLFNTDYLLYASCCCCCIILIMIFTSMS